MTKLISSLITLIFLSQTLFAQTDSEVLTNDSVISLIDAGLDKSIIITTVNNSDSKFDVSPKGLIYLKKKGVSDDVLKVIIEKANVSGKKETNIIAIPILNHPYFLMDGQYELLEKNSASIKTKAKGMGFGGVNTSFNLKGESSKSKSSSDASFVINRGVNGAPKIGIYKLEVKKGSRNAVTSQTSVVGKYTTDSEAIPFNVSKVEEGIYKIQLEAPLEQGEYFILNLDQTIVDYLKRDVYTFSVD